MPADHTHHLAEHARQRHDQTLQRAQQTLTELTDAGEQVTVALLAARAKVSRSWIYTQPELRNRLRQLQQHHASAGFVRDAVTPTTHYANVWPWRTSESTSYAPITSNSVTRSHMPTANFAQPASTWSGLVTESDA
jgi:hypothetical protein